MPDKEKLTDAMNDVKAVENYLRKQGETWYADILSDAFDTLALLIEQEPMEPHAERDCDDGVWYYGCGVCHGAIDYKDKFCRHCGREVKWDA